MTEKEPNPHTDDFAPVLADDIEIRFFKSDDRGDFFMLRNPRDKRYIKIHESVKPLVETMDGTKTVADLKRNAPSDIDVEKLVHILARGGFLKGFEAQKKEEPFYTWKIPLFKSNKPIFTRIYRCCFFMGRTPFKVVYALFVGGGIILFLTHLSETFNYMVKTLDITVPMTPLVLMLIMFYVVEVIHEFAHTGASYNHGAEPVDIGIVFHFLVFLFYVETPDTRILSPKARVETFLAGPLTTLFAASICTYIFVFTDSYPILWGSASFFWHLSALINLSPFMQADGYYIAQSMLKFPNLFKHSLNYVKLNVFRLVGKVKKEYYEKALTAFTQRERRIMKIFAVFTPIQVGLWVYFAFFMAVKINFFKVLQLGPVILFGEHTYGFKAYFLLFSYSFTVIALIIAAFMMGYRFFKLGPKERW